MINALVPLAELPGVELVMLATVDGVPIATCGPRSDKATGPHSSEEVGALNDDAMAAMALSWIGEMQRSTAPLGWGEAERALLRCARGSLVMQRCRGAILVILLAPSISSEELRLPMAGAVARIERSNRNTVPAPVSEQPNPPGALPSKGGPAPAIEISSTQEPHQE